MEDIINHFYFYNNKIILNIFFLKLRGMSKDIFDIKFKSIFLKKIIIIITFFNKKTTFSLIQWYTNILEL